MLSSLTLNHLGPAPKLAFSFGSRLNLLTGDNGLGKTFLLDIAWWALTRCWVDGKPLHPSAHVEDASVNFAVKGKAGRVTEVSRCYLWNTLDWAPLPSGRPPDPGLVIYARIDGGFSVYDSHRNRGAESEDEPGRRSQLEAFHLTKNELWDGQKDGQGRVICRGLLEDWETWSLKDNGAFSLLKSVLERLSPGGKDSPLRPGPSVRSPEKGSLDLPTVVMPYGPVPLHQASAGMKRVISLAYVLVWAWTEHQLAAADRRLEPTERIVLLLDEVEAHLHPQWQRSLLPAVVGVLESLLAQCLGPQVQIIATTHAPFVMASVETLFDTDKDKLFNLEIESGGAVVLEEILWAKCGNVIDWLRSPAFDMKSGYSREAEAAIAKANRWLRGERENLSKQQIEQDMAKSLAAGDPFWARWTAKTGGPQ